MPKRLRFPTKLALAVLLALAIPFPAPADPPPWAPAHGWRKKHDPYYVGYTGHKWDKDYGVIGGRCNTEAVGAVLGGAVGGAVGSRVGQGSDRVIATILGTAIGAVVGSKIGRQIDERDRACMGHALELMGDGRPVAWKNAATGVDYRLTPVRGYEVAGAPCRDFTTRARSGGKTETTNGTACRRGDGVWEYRK
ncbi:MAG TPA: RT0821/Lpp0805 family surface protein [Burkholderiales bacterium]|nr:RT0821/Lpp0805 family surface protein [Burkholderiales bacterium]